MLYAETMRNAGLVFTRRSRETGLLVSVYRNREALLDDADGRYPYSTVCEEHGQICAHESLRLARHHAANPTGWCEVCMDREDRG
jgi:hypothetical protein